MKHFFTRVSGRININPDTGGRIMYRPFGSNDVVYRHYDQPMSAVNLKLFMEISQRCVSGQCIVSQVVPSFASPLFLKLT